MRIRGSVKIGSQVLAGIAGITWYPWFQSRSEGVFTADICERITEIALCSSIALIGMSQWSVRDLDSPITQGEASLTRNAWEMRGILAMS